MADEKTKAVGKQVGTAAAGAIGTAVGSPALGAVAAQGASSICDCCCGNASKSAEQKKAIEQQNPLTGDPAVDAQIQKNRDDAFKKWQRGEDVAAFEQLPPDTQALLPGLKKFVDGIYAEIPPADRNLTLGEAAKKYPEIAQRVWGELQKAMPSLQGMPLEYALAMASASGADKVKLSEIKERIDYVAENAPTAKKLMAGSMDIGTAAVWGLGALAGIAAVAWGIKKYSTRKK